MSRRNTWPSGTSSVPKPSWTGLSSKPGLRCEKNEVQNHWRAQSSNIAFWNVGFSQTEYRFMLSCSDSGWHPFSVWSYTDQPARSTVWRCIKNVHAGISDRWPDVVSWGTPVLSEFCKANTGLVCTVQ